ncbi:MAG: flippase activity-associated protein Agl23 [Candidatus Altiarchaeia archaeon]
MRDRKFYIIFAVIFALGLFIRVYDLTGRPLHHDEGVIGWFELNIYKACMGPKTDYSNYAKSCGSSYSYDPEYHGPLPFLAGAWFFALFGVSDYTLRLPFVILSLGLILLLLFLRKELGDTGVLASGALIAFSPSMAFYGQSINDNYTLFFALGSIVCACRLAETKRSKWLYLGTASLTLLFTVKETAFLFVGLSGAYLLMLALFRYGGSFIRAPGKTLSACFFAALKCGKKWMKRVLLSLLLSAFIYCFVYSTMFTDFGDVWKGITYGFTFWLGRSTTWSAHFKPFDYYLDILLGYELAVCVLSLAALFVLRSGFSRWCAWWSITTLAIYSCVPYKTPWLDINFVLPMALLAGAGVNEYSLILKEWKRYLPVLFLIPLLFYSLYAAWDATYANYNSESNKLSYVGTLDDYTKLIRDISAKADIYGMNNTNIAIVVTDPWPLPWSLRDYNVSYGGSQLKTLIIITEKDGYSRIAPDMRYRYDAPGKYEIRKGMYIYAYSWKDIQA